MKRDKTIILRLTNEEYNYIKLKMNEKDFENLSDYMRTSAITPIKINKNKNLSMLYEVNKIGVNLNQVIRKMHKLNFINQELIEYIRECEIDLNQLIILFAQD